MQFDRQCSSKVEKYSVFFQKGIKNVGKKTKEEIMMITMIAVNKVKYDNDDEIYRKLC